LLAAVSLFTISAVALNGMLAKTLYALRGSRTSRMSVLQTRTFST